MTFSPLETPVALLIFKRPDTTQLVFEAIRQVQPQRLLIVSNYPAPGDPEALERCLQARAICDRIDWPCTVSRTYADSYLSCKTRIASGLDWVFQQVDRAIILEDDCVPHPSFFYYCQDLLAYYRHDQRVMAITGDNFSVPQRDTRYSYYFSRYTHFWGWATWQRAWQHYDVTLSQLPEMDAQGWLAGLLPNPKALAWWRKTLQSVYDGQKDTWDYPWLLSCWRQNGLCIVPKVNLVTNLGFRADATHNRDELDWRAHLPVQAMPLPLQHPPYIMRDDRADCAIQARYYDYIAAKQQRPLSYRLRRKWRQMVRSIFP
jgi:hypothetical protein